MSPTRKTDASLTANKNDHLIDTIHPAYHITFPLSVYANVLIFVPTLLPSLILSLGLSVS
jgi:hypothetical protein